MIRFVFVSLIFCTSTVQAAIWRKSLRELPQVNQDWSADLSTPVGQKAIEAAKEIQWESDLTYYPRDFAKILEVARKYDELHPLTAEQKRMSYERTQFQFVPIHATYGYSKEKVALFRAQLKNIVDQALPDSGVVVTPLAPEDLLRTARSPNLFQRLLFLWPLAFNQPEVGRVFQSDYLKSRIDEISDFDLAQIYNTDWKDEVLRRIQPVVANEAQDTARWVAWVKRNLYKKLAFPAFKMEASYSALTGKKSLVLESTPPLIALARGEWGRDCSRWSVLLYALSKGAKVYAVRLDEEDRPNGYVFVAEAKYKERTLPYILTVNGDGQISFAVTRAVVSAVARLYKSDEVLVPTFRRKGPWVVNTDLIRAGLQFSGSEDVEITMPEDWGTIARYTYEHDRLPTYEDLYGRADILQSKLVRLSQYPEMEAIDTTILGQETRFFPQIVEPERLLESGLQLKATFDQWQRIYEGQHQQQTPTDEAPDTVRVRDDFQTVMHSLGSQEVGKFSPELQERYRRTENELQQQLMRRREKGWVQLEKTMDVLQRSRGLVASPEWQQLEVFARVLRALVTPLENVTDVLSGNQTASTLAIEINRLSLDKRRTLLAVWNQGQPKLESFSEIERNKIPTSTADCERQLLLAH